MLHAILAAMVAPVPLVHLWLHALLPSLPRREWLSTRHPWLFYVFAGIIFILAFLFFPFLANISSPVFMPSPFFVLIGWMLILLGFFLVFWSLSTLGIRRFFVWETFRPSGLSEQKITSGPFRFLPHPAYFGYLLIAVGNFFSDGSLYLISVLVYLVTTTPIVIRYEEEELRRRIGSV